MPLNLTEFNHFILSAKYAARKNIDTILRLWDFVPGSEVTILSELHGYYIVMVKGSKIGLDKTLAKKIIVYAN